MKARSRTRLDAGQTRFARNVRRDPVDLPKTIRTKKTAIERSIRKLGESANDSRESLRLKQKIDDAIFRLQQHARNEGMDVPDISKMLDVLFRNAAEAMHRSTDNYRTYLQEESERLHRKLREAQPRPGSHEHELAMMRGRDRRRGGR